MYSQWFIFSVKENTEVFSFCDEFVKYENIETSVRQGSYEKKRVRISPKILTLFFCDIFIYVIDTTIPFTTQIDVNPEKFPLTPKLDPQSVENDPATNKVGTRTVLH